MNPKLAKAIQIAIAVITAVSLAGPMLAELGGLVPAQWLSVASRGVGFCGAFVLWLSQSPQVAALLQVRPTVVSKVSVLPCPACGCSVPSTVRIRTP